MQQTQSRLIKSLDQQIAAALNPVQGACLMAQRAIALVRHGQLSEARDQLTTLHQLAFQHPHSSIGAWLHLAEGLMSYFTDFSSAAREKTQRALAIARTAKLAEVEALSLAWLAHLAYARHDLPALIGHAQEGLKVVGAGHHAARSRLSMVLALAHHYSGRADLAQAWYAAARRHATLDGDDATLSALIYNMAEMQTAQARHAALADASGRKPELLLGADSVKNFDAAFGGSAMESLTPILRAQTLVLQGEFDKARELFEQHLPVAMSHGLARLGSSLLADLAWCRLNCGQREHALRQAHEAEVELDPGCEVDDRAATHSRLAQVYEALDEAGKAAWHREAAEREWAEFAAQKKQWAEALEAAGLVKPA
ncbi:hypothetical protein ABT392_08475 [Paucibacter sp. JuS9]|uniref:hypothetical protein n=1 Tax=Paucibacter sp. JuS9 TaxID=3228748 RepID=UPI003757B4F7